MALGDADDRRFDAGLDRKRKGKKLSNEELDEPDRSRCEDRPMKDGSSHLAFKPEHAVDLGHRRGGGGADAIRRRLATRRRSAPHWKRRRRTSPPWVLPPTSPKIPATSWLTKGYHSRDGLKALDGGPWKTRIAEPKLRQGLFALAWRRRGARGGVCQPQPIEIEASASRPCASCMAKWSSAASPMFLIGAACLRRAWRCAVARTFTSAI